MEARPVIYISLSLAPALVKRQEQFRVNHHSERRRSALVVVVENEEAHQDERHPLDRHITLCVFYARRLLVPSVHKSSQISGHPSGKTVFRMAVVVSFRIV